MCIVRKTTWQSHSCMWVLNEPFMAENASFSTVVMVQLFADLQILQGRITCQHQGNLYKEGDTFYPEDTPCYTCICDKNFDGLEPIASNRNCRKIDCGLELRHFHELRQGCVPIYFKTSSCCPHDFRCRKLYVIKWLVNIFNCFVITLKPMIKMRLFNLKDIQML